MDTDGDISMREWDLKKAKAEIARLRAALELIAEQFLPAWPAAEEAREIARKALANEQSTVEERKEHCFGAFSRPPR